MSITGLNNKTPLLSKEQTSTNNPPSGVSSFLGRIKSAFVKTQPEINIVSNKFPHKDDFDKMEKSIEFFWNEIKRGSNPRVIDLNEMTLYPYREKIIEGTIIKLKNLEETIYKKIDSLKDCYQCELENNSSIDRDSYNKRFIFLSEEKIALKSAINCRIDTLRYRNLIIDSACGFCEQNKNILDDIINIKEEKNLQYKLKQCQISFNSTYNLINEIPKSINKNDLNDEIIFANKKYEKLMDAIKSVSDMKEIDAMFARPAMPGNRKSP